MMPTLRNSAVAVPMATMSAVADMSGMDNMPHLGMAQTAPGMAAANMHEPGKGHGDDSENANR